METLSNMEVGVLFELIERATNQELFAIIEYAKHEINTRNEQALINFREKYIKS